MSSVKFAKELLASLNKRLPRNGTDDILRCIAIDQSNKGFAMMVKMGYIPGTSLGKDTIATRRVRAETVPKGGCQCSARTRAASLWLLQGV